MLENFHGNGNLCNCGDFLLYEIKKLLFYFTCFKTFYQHEKKIYEIIEIKKNILIICAILFFGLEF